MLAYEIKENGYDPELVEVIDTILTVDEAARHETALARGEITALAPMQPSTEVVLRKTIEQQRKIIELQQLRIKNRDTTIERDHGAHNERYKELFDQLVEAKNFNRKQLKQFRQEVLLPGAWITGTVIPCCSAFGALWFTARQGALLGTGLALLFFLAVGASWIGSRKADLPAPSAIEKPDHEHFQRRDAPPAPHSEE
jgi:hypothetical protein